ncbi:hypothetical protein ACKVMT_01820 [Halobacteriales archaeon Cl-PHB]
MAGRANPAFAIAAVLVPVAALTYAVTVGRFVEHLYVHVMAGVLWTGIDLFMAIVLGPVIGGLDTDESASVFQRFTPKMTFLMPTLALVTIAGGITLAIRMGYLPAANTWWAIFTAATVLPALALIGWQFDAFRDRRWLLVTGLAVVGSGAGLVLTIGEFAWPSPLILAALAIVTVLSVLGFGVLLPGEVKMYLEMVSADPDSEVIRRIGMRNAKLSGIQGLFQLGIIVVMVLLRWYPPA